MTPVRAGASLLPNIEILVPNHTPKNAQAQNSKPKALANENCSRTLQLPRRLFKDKSEIKPWLQAQLAPKGISIVIARSDDSKIVFKCKSGSKFHGHLLNNKGPRSNTKNSKKHRAGRAHALQPDCPFRIRANFSVRAGTWSLVIVDDRHNHPLAPIAASKYIPTSNYTRNTQSSEAMGYRTPYQIPTLSVNHSSLPHLHESFGSQFTFPVKSPVSINAMAKAQLPIAQVSSIQTSIVQGHPNLPPPRDSAVRKSNTHTPGSSVPIRTSNLQLPPPSNFFPPIYASCDPKFGPNRQQQNYGCASTTASSPSEAKSAVSRGSSFSSQSSLSASVAMSTSSSTENSAFRQDHEEQQRLSQMHIKINNLLLQLNSSQDVADLTKEETCHSIIMLLKSSIQSGSKGSIESQGFKGRKPKEETKQPGRSNGAYKLTVQEVVPPAFQRMRSPYVDSRPSVGQSRGFSRRSSSIVLPSISAAFSTSGGSSPFFRRSV